MRTSSMEKLTVIQTATFQQRYFKSRKQIYELYSNNTQYINNWDLVDSSAHLIVGAFLMDKSKTPLYRLMKSNNMWEDRISVMATFKFIKSNLMADTLTISVRCS